MAGNAAEVRGDANAAAGVAANVERRTSSGDNGRGTTAAPATRARDVVRIVGAAVDQIIGLEGEREVGRVGLAHENRAGGAQTLHHGRILGGDKACASLGAAGGNEAGGFERILDGDRNAVQAAARCGRDFVGCCGLGECAIAPQLHNSVERRIHRGDAIEIGGNGGDARGVTLANGGGQIDEGE